jgi:hypothetical protein
MKRKHFIALLCAPLLFTACKKDQQTGNDTEPKKYDVTFTMSNFNQSVVKMNAAGTKATQAATDNVRDYIKYAYFRIYDSNGAVVTDKSQNNTQAEFGTFTDKLPAGNYTAVFVGSPTYMAYSATGVNLSTAQFFPALDVWDDTFYKQIPITIGTDGITQPVVLDRVIGGLDVVLDDAIPANAAKVTVTFEQNVGSIYLNGKSTALPKSITTPFVLTAADKGVKGKVFSSYIANVTSPSKVFIRAYDGSNVLIVEKSVLDVRCYVNQKTILKGSLFPIVPATSAFTISLDPTWGASAATVNF